LATHDNTYHRLRELVKLLPEKPGIYQFYDKNQKLLYVGKAKNLKKRVTSYFSKKHESNRTAVMVKRIHDVKHTVVETETDALLLENSLIKQNQPRYNVMLKDDKTYPWLVIKNESFPRVFLTRNVIKDGSEYFGPYTSVRMVRTLLEFIRQLYPLRTCKYTLSDKNIKAGKYKRCLEYHIGKCLAPCEGLQSKADYNANIDNVRNIIKGNLNAVQKYMQKQMEAKAAEYKFEEAEDLRQKIELMNNYKSKSTIVNPNLNNIDVFGMAEDKHYSFINYLKISNGAIIQTHTQEIRKRIDEPPEDILATAMHDIRNKVNSTAQEALVPMPLQFIPEGMKVSVPQRGDKKKLLDLSVRNAKYAMLEKHKQIEHTNPEKHRQRILETLQQDLKMDKLPEHIECFDNSNIQGHYPVAACVVFKNGRPQKKAYRHYNIKSVSGPDDYASMTEVITRRYKRMLEENHSLPQLIIIDGGRGQLSAAVEGLKKLKIEEKITIVGIAKRLEEIFFQDDPVPLYLDKNSESLKLIQQARDEAHRFGIKFHRNKRSKAFITSDLTNIPGIGEKTAELLLRKFGSVEQIKKLPASELEKTVGKSKAKRIKEAIGK
jgi:excinuclease ABC subunit C